VLGIHVLLALRFKDVDGRDRPGHDGREMAEREKTWIRAIATGWSLWFDSIGTHLALETRPPSYWQMR
jgi:hypothetical protein